MRQGSIRRFPWGSLVMLLCAYATLGKFLAGMHHAWGVWSLAIAWVFLLAAFFRTPLSSIGLLLQGWLKSDTIAFLSLTLAAALISILYIWMSAVLHGLVVFAAEALTRLDMQSSKFNPSQAFWLLIVTSLLGLAVGWGIDRIAHLG